MNFQKATSGFKWIVFIWAVVSALTQGGTITCPLVNAPGDKVFALPGSTFTVCFEDLALPGGDKDYNDQVFTGLVNADGTSATLSFFGSDAAINDVLRYQGADVWSNLSHPVSVAIPTSPLQELLFVLVAAGNTFFTGTQQAIVWQVVDRDVNAVPEPSTLSVVIGGLLLLGAGYSLVANKRKKREEAAARVKSEQFVAGVESGAFKVDLRTGRITLMPGVWRVEHPIVFMTSMDTRLVGITMPADAPGVRTIEDRQSEKHGVSDPDGYFRFPVA